MRRCTEAVISLSECIYNQHLYDCFDFHQIMDETKVVSGCIKRLNQITLDVKMTLKCYVCLWAGYIITVHSNDDR